jgi:predicted nucleic acid-binding protein
MVKALFDTNILIDYLNGIAAANQEITRHADSAISVITWMEVMVGATAQTESTLLAWLSGFAMVPIDARVSEIAVVLRKQYRMRLPDAIVWASAPSQGRILVTLNKLKKPAFAKPLWPRKQKNNPPHCHPVFGIGPKMPIHATVPAVFALP